MGIALFTIVFAILALILSLIVSTNVAGWFVWILYAIISVFFFIRSMMERNSFYKGIPKTENEVAAMSSMPYYTVIMGIVLIVLLFIDKSKLHLLWMYPVVSITFEYIMVKKIIKMEDNKQEQ